MKDIKELTKEIEYYIEGLSESYADPTIKVSIEDKTCTIHISKMYHGLGKMVSFQALNWLSKLLGTDQIDLKNEDYRGGCESCDWGSEHSVDIVCKNITL
jgi:hypothetical protein